MYASPVIPHTLHNTSFLVDISSPTCNDIHHCRTLLGTILSCIATIFACTWISYHADVPPLPPLPLRDPDPVFRSKVVRFYSTVFALLLPEFAIAKAASQWSTVFFYTPRFQAKFQGWTRAHTYFTVMGGFVHNGEPLSLLNVLRLNADLHPEILTREPESRGIPRADNIKPRILVTDSEINDKSKGNTVGIGVAALQTAWFVLQYLDRWTSHRPRTQLEVMTLAYITISVIISLLWWNKPRDIQKPILFVHFSDNDDVNSDDQLIPDVIPVTLSQRLIRGVSNRIGRFATGTNSPNNQLIPVVLPVTISNQRSTRVLNHWMIKPVAERVQTLGRFRNMRAAWSSLTHGVNRGPSATSLLAFGALFGGIHCFAWSSHFPTRPEAILWKVCAVYCAGYYIPISIIIFIAELAPFKRIEIIAATMGVFLFFGYVVCRVILFVLTFISLRALPPGIYETTNWLSFLPHVG